MQNRHATHAKGFTLVELSIVLVILGLLVGGVLTGQSLIRAAELRSVSTDYSRYLTAAQTFRDKYFAMPGDITNATAYWGKDNTNCASDTGTTATNGTCNGNGDGVISGYGSPPSRESLHYWQQLALAGLIEGSYTGVGTASPLNGTIAIGVPGVNIPKSKISNGAGWTPFYLPQHASEVGSFSDLPATSFNFMLLGVNVANYWAQQSFVLSPEEVYNVDVKMDDGKPAYGMVRGGYNAVGYDPCYTPTTSAAAYNLSVRGKVCLIAFKMD